jgi:hypothetical protein
MTQTEMKLLLKRAMIHNPIFIDVHKPLLGMVRTVLEGKSQQIARTFKKTLAIIGEMLSERVDLLSKPDRSENFMNLDQYYYHFMQLKYGAESLVEKYLESWMNSFILHAPRDSRVDMFKRFMGLTGTGNWPFSVFRYYL